MVHAELALRARAALSHAGLLPPPAVVISTKEVAAKAAASQHDSARAEGREAPQAPLLGT